MLIGNSRKHHPSLTQPRQGLSVQVRRRSLPSHIRRTLSRPRLAPPVLAAARRSVVNPPRKTIAQVWRDLSTGSKRTISAALGIGVTFSTIVFSVSMMKVLGLAATTIALKEFFNVTFSAQQKGLQRTFTTLGSVAMGALLVFGTPPPMYVLPVLGALFVATSFRVLRSPKEGSSNPIDHLSKLTLGLIYIPYFLNHLLWVRMQPEGAVLLLAILSAIHSADIGAYFVGKKFGKRLIAPRVSKGKTWEGFIGGGIPGAIAGTAIMLGGAAAFGFWQGSILMPALGLGVTCATLGVASDLFQSLFKRHFDFKDSAQKLPGDENIIKDVFLGHGGMWDRLDSILPTAVAAYYVLVNIL